MKNLNIPYEIAENGYSWTLIGIKNDFPQQNTFVNVEYENQYGHIKQLDRRHLEALQDYKASSDQKIFGIGGT